MKNYLLMPVSVIALFSISTAYAADEIIDGSLCVGFDCVVGESFGFDTIRVKENNMRINFVDTSASSSFPANDWRIVINDSSNGGANYFAIEDSNAARQIFRVEAGAPANSLYVESDGDVGIKTANPVVDLHIVEGNTPTIRLEQNGSSGFTPQTWDLAGNEANFFIRDATNGSTLPFRIEPSTPSNSIYIEAGGEVGMGTDSPADDLHIVDTGPARIRLTNSSASNTDTTDKDWVLNSNSTFRISAGTDAAEFTLDADGNLGLNAPTPLDDLHIIDTGPARIRLTNSSQSNSATTDQDWILNSNGNFRISAGSDSPELTLSADGDLVVSGGFFVNAQELSVPDYVFESSYELKSIEDQAAYMKNNKHLPSVGAAPIVDENGGTLNLVEQQLGMLEELEKAHLYIVTLHDQIKQYHRQLTKLDSRLKMLETSH